MLPYQYWRRWMDSTWIWMWVVVMQIGDICRLEVHVNESLLHLLDCSPAGFGESRIGEMMGAASSVGRSVVNTATSLSIAISTSTSHGCLLRQCVKELLCVVLCLVLMMCIWGGIVIVVRLLSSLLVNRRWVRPYIVPVILRKYPTKNVGFWYRNHRTTF